MVISERKEREKEKRRDDYSNYFKTMVYFESTDCKVCEFRDKCENFFKDNKLIVYNR